MLCGSPHSALRHLKRFDDRLAAHLDGLSIAGDEGASICDASLESPSPGAVFVVAVAAIEKRQNERLSSVIGLAQAVPETKRGLFAAFGWLEPDYLQGLVSRLLTSEDSFVRLVGVAACALHRVEPGFASARWMQDRSAQVRARYLRAVGDLGLQNLLPECATAIADRDPDIRFWAAWAAVLLGDRGAALKSLTSSGLVPGTNRARAFRLALQAMGLSASHQTLQNMGREPEIVRWLIQGSGIAGDPTYVPWLIRQMVSDETARLAGEAFSLITGADLALMDLERKPRFCLDLVRW
jgi:uncharacterized protein (TIGR02270 family)